MMRALAHPARMTIWTFVNADGPATATECADVAGLSPSLARAERPPGARRVQVTVDLTPWFPPPPDPGDAAGRE